jgi:ABC-2 type transport system ATP-binding protein
LSELAEVCHGAVILERGRILRAGTMGELLAAATPLHTVRIRSLGDEEELRRALLAMPGVDDVRLVANEVEADVAGDDQAAAVLLAELVRAGVPVVEFRRQRNGLEEIFMAVTRGDVA